VASTAANAAEHVDEPFDQTRVRLIEQTVEPLTLPADADF